MIAPPPNDTAPVGGEAPAPDRGRLRFTGYRFVRTPTGQCTAEVELTWTDGRTMTGRASGQSSPLGDYRIAADAALHAIEGFVAGIVRFEIIGVKAIKAFDANVVIVSIHAHRDGPVATLLGCYLAEGDAIKAAAYAVLNATNRMIGNAISTR